MYLPEDGDRTNIIEISIGLCLKIAIKPVSETSVYMRTEAEPIFETSVCPTSEVYISFYSGNGHAQTKYTHAHH
jgi:hypothetical protein